MMCFKRLSPKQNLRVDTGTVAIFVALAVVPGFSSHVAAGQSSEQSPVASGHQSKSQRSITDQAGEQTFSSAAEASQALVTALQSNDRDSLLKLLGASTTDILSSGDETEDKENREQFVQKYQQMHRLLTEPDGTTTLYIGAENWPTPIPLVHKGNTWYFDTAAGRQEIFYRRIGNNELTVIHVCHELADAEKEYDAQPHDNDSERQYAQKILSDSGKHNGLYWKPASGESDSPLGHFVAAAEREGYAEDGTRKPQPFHGVSRLLLSSLEGAGTEYTWGCRKLPRRRENDARLCIPGLSGGIPLIGSDDLPCGSGRNCL